MSALISRWRSIPRWAQLVILAAVVIFVPPVINIVERQTGFGLLTQVNRALISKGDTRALVYYWFMQRGRYLTSEYLVKWFIFWDSLWHNRSDGAMVRVTVPLTGGEDIATADRRVAEFIRAAEPKLYYFIPQESLDVRPLRVR